MLRSISLLGLTHIVALWFSALLLVGCARLEPPELTPRSVEVDGVNVTGMTVAVEVDVYNPNRIDLSVKEVTGTIRLDDSVKLGRATVNTEEKLPGRKTQRVKAKLKIPWTSITQVAGIARTKDPIPYTFKGEARIGGKLSVEVPFTIQGEVSSAQLLQATLRGLPGLPGLNLQ